MNSELMCWIGVVTLEREGLGIKTSDVQVVGDVREKHRQRWVGILGLVEEDVLLEALHNRSVQSCSQTISMVMMTTTSVGLTGAGTGCVFRVFKKEEVRPAKMYPTYRCRLTIRPSGSCTAFAEDLCPNPPLESIIACTLQSVCPKSPPQHRTPEANPLDHLPICLWRDAGTQSEAHPLEQCLGKKGLWRRKGGKLILKKAVSLLAYDICLWRV